MITRLGRTALYFYSVITVIKDCFPFFKWEEKVVEGGKTVFPGLNHLEILSLGQEPFAILLFRDTVLGHRQLASKQRQIFKWHLAATTRITTGKLT